MVGEVQWVKMGFNGFKIGSGSGVSAQTPPLAGSFAPEADQEGDSCHYKKHYFTL